MATTKNIIMKQFNGTDYDTLYPKTNVEQVENLTPSSIGAVAKTGDTMTGNLTINRDYPQVTMNSPLAGRDSYIAYIGNEKNLYLMNRLDVNNRQGIYITPETSSLSKALRLMRVVDGTANYYSVVHEGNLSDLGVARIATGSYTGTGTYGSDKPNRLTLPFEPKFLYVSTATGFALHTRNNTTHVLRDTLFWQEGINSTEERSDVVYISRSGNTISWYSSDMRSQLNDSGEEYYYIAIG